MASSIGQFLDCFQGKKSTKSPPGHFCAWGVILCSRRTSLFVFRSTSITSRCRRCCSFPCVVNAAQNIAKMDTALVQGDNKMAGQGRISTCGVFASSPGLRGGSIASEMKEGNVFYVQGMKSLTSDSVQCPLRTHLSLHII